MCSVVFGKGWISSKAWYRNATQVDNVYYPDDARYYLKSELDARIKRRPHYSLRAFARDLGLSPSTVSDYLKGKMGLSRDRIHQLSKKLNLSLDQREHWCDLLEARYSRNPESRKTAQVRARARTMESKNRLALEKFQIISGWQHFAIIELIEISVKYHSADAIAKALGIRVKVVRESIDRLEKLNMIHTKSTPWTVVAGTNIFGGTDVTNKALREFHAQSLEKALQALESQSITKRESQTIIFGISDEKISEMKNELSKLMIDFIVKHADAPQEKNSVYCMSSHLFSLMEGN